MLKLLEKELPEINENSHTINGKYSKIMPTSMFQLAQTHNFDKNSWEIQTDGISVISVISIVLQFFQPLKLHSTFFVALIMCHYLLCFKIRNCRCFVVLCSKTYNVSTVPRPIVRLWNLFVDHSYFLNFSQFLSWFIAHALL